MKVKEWISKLDGNTKSEFLSNGVKLISPEKLKKRLNEKAESLAEATAAVFKWDESTEGEGKWYSVHLAAVKAAEEANQPKGKAPQ